ncbi:MAG: glycosyltransferase [Proteobacteria bacterium]|nr:glycosyltransferase [Pseudomonadota bacterium]
MSIKNTPLFSIVSIARDNGGGLKRTRDSLTRQSHGEYEWIVIDGASTDGTAEWLRETDAAWISETDSGIYDAMNKGIEKAQGEYLIFMNAGDEFAIPDCLEKIAQLPDADFIYGDALEAGHYKKARSHEKINYGMFTHHQAMIYRRETIGSLRYDTNYAIAADYKFTLEFLNKARNISYTPFPLCVFEQGGISQKDVARGRKEQFRIRRETRACAPPKNAAIYAGQTVVMALRQIAPRAYWRIKQKIR